jgi:DNA-binding XRE family transcriptional regulator
MSPATFQAARHYFGLTQKEWGLSLGIGREHVAKLEAGTMPVSRTVAILVELYLRHGLARAETKE